MIYACLGGVFLVGCAIATLVAYDMGNKKGYAQGYRRGLECAETIAVVLAKDKAAKEEGRE